MSNRVTIQPTIFENHPTGEKTHGFRFYDDYAQFYCNTLESPLPDNDLDMLRLVMDNLDDVGSAMIDYIIENEVGINIGGEWYDYEAIADIVNRQEKTA